MMSGKFSPWIISRLHENPIRTCVLTLSVITESLKRSNLATPRVAHHFDHGSGGSVRITVVASTKARRSGVLNHIIQQNRRVNYSRLFVGSNDP